MPLWHNIAEMMDYYIPPVPSVYWIDVTRRCNLRCIMCPQSAGLRCSQSDMSMAMFRNIIDEVRENEPLVKLYLSGEPLLHEGLFDMIAYAGARGCRTMIHTNATMLTRDTSEKLLLSSLTFLSLSFDGCSAEVYEKLRPPARFERVESNIRRFLDLRRANGKRGPHTTIEIIRMQETRDGLADFIEQWRGSGVDDVRVTDCLTWLGGVKDRRVDPTHDGGAYQPCEAPFRHGCILSDGTVVPCCMDVNGRLPLGNVTEKAFRDIWAGNGYRRLRLQMLTGTVSPTSICYRCDNTFRQA
ncbi:MAG: SPASM domain-containing protein [Sedimentisphaerales bacterium]|nr:SPASM domain-containing protein [Sedimentisphaerales bacterium]